MENFFENIDTSRRYLLLGDTRHDDLNIRDFVYSEKFITAAIAHGYTKLLVEGEAAQEVREYLAEKRKDLIALGLEIEPVDWRTEIEKEQYIRSLDAFANIWEKWTAGGKEVTEARRRAFNQIYNELPHGLVDAPDDRPTLDKILTYAATGKVMVFYGAGHMSKDSIIEHGIPRSERTIVLLCGDKTSKGVQVFDRNVVNFPADDCFEYDVNKGSFLHRPVYTDEENRIIWRAGLASASMPESARPQFETKKFLVSSWDNV